MPVAKTVFVSYRRVDVSWALAIFNALTREGYDVFFDFEGIGSGDFESVILENIRSRAHFLVLLTPTALDRCHAPRDWLRREVEEAIAQRRNVVPVLLGGFSFDDANVAAQLTGDLLPLKSYGGLQVHSDYFKEAIDRLCDRYLRVSLEEVPHPASPRAQAAAVAAQAAATAAISAHPPDLRPAAAEVAPPALASDAAAPKPPAEDGQGSSGSDEQGRNRLRWARLLLRSTVAREKTSRMTRYVRETPGKRLTVHAIVAAAALAGAASLGSLAVDVLKPWVTGWLQPSKKLAAVSGEWRGIYFSPSSHASKRTAPQTNVAVMCHEKGVQTWNVNQRGESFTAAISEPSTANDKILHWNGTGFLKDQSTLVVSTVGDRAGVGTMYLSRHPDHGYYRGFAYLCDCHSYVAEAVMICPYVLYKGDVPKPVEPMKAAAPG